MTFFADPASEQVPTPQPSRRALVRKYGGFIPLVIALIAMFLLSVLPTGYVIQQPGPVMNTLGSSEVNGKKEPLINVGDAATYPTNGQLSLTTVQVVGNREKTPSWFELFLAWFDPSRAVVPIDVLYPKGTSADEKREQDQVAMVSSQTEASAAALRALGYDVQSEPQVASVQEGSAAAGKLKAGDVIRSVNGSAVQDVQQIRDTVNAGGGTPVQFVVSRDGKDVEETLTPTQQEVQGKKQWLVGIGLTEHIEKLPVDVKIQLENIGGPSAGMMFALGIYDTMTPGSLANGKDIAGTGTIDSSGRVGPIGGIQQKLYGAKNAGDKYFLAPDQNCNEVVGHIPDGLKVYATSTLKESIGIVETIAAGGSDSNLRTCAQVMTEQDKQK